MNFKNHKDSLLFLPLGGSNEIGMNVNLYYYKGKWLMLDLGAGFADDYYPGVDMLAPDLSFILEHRKDFLGVVLTHAHEDHMGGVPYVWGQLRCPIYATPFTAEVVRNKLQDDHIPLADQIHEVEPGSEIEIGPFSMEMIGITHSIPEMNGLMLRTEHGTIFHTGDWKLDEKPVVGPTSDEKSMKAYGDEGVLAMVCDSTNVFTEGTSGSEGDLLKSISELIAGCSGLVIITTFASNIARLETLARAAEVNGRSVALAGRSLRRFDLSARETGYLKDIQPFIDDREIKHIPRENLMVICTGCQGESRAAMSKIITGQHPTIRLLPDDLVIFSSKIIPGNEKPIFHMMNSLVRLGIEVMTEKDHFVHVSGHPARDELHQMYKLIRPEISIPVHGEPVHIHEHMKFARELGVPKQVEAENGKVIKIAPGEPETLGYVHSGYLAVDGNALHPPDGDVMRKRRKMRWGGIVFITLVVNQKGHLLSKPRIATPGVLDEEASEAAIQELSEEIADTLEDLRDRNDEKLERVTRKVAKSFIEYETGKTPLLRVQVVRVKV